MMPASDVKKPNRSQDAINSFVSDTRAKKLSSDTKQEDQFEPNDLLLYQLDRMRTIEINLKSDKKYAQDQTPVAKQKQAPTWSCTPMERWQQETVHQAPWNIIHSVNPLRHGDAALEILKGGEKRPVWRYSG